MKQFTFSTPKWGASDNLWEGIFGLVLIIVPIVYPFGLRAGRLKIPVPYSTGLFILVGIGLLIYAFLSYRRKTSERKLARPIIVDGQKVTVHQVTKKDVFSRTFELSDILNMEYDESEDTLRVSTTQGYFNFPKNYFENEECYHEFAEILYSKPQTATESKS